MAEQMEKKITWILDKYSDSEKVRRSFPFARANCNWCIVAYLKGDKNDSHFSLFLELADDARSLPPEWTKEVKYSLTLVSNGGRKLKKGGQRFFNANKICWGFPKFVSLADLENKSEGYLVNDSLTIQAVVVEPEETVKITEPLSGKDGNQAGEASLRDSSSCQAAQKSDNGEDISLLNQSRASEEASHTVGNDGMNSNAGTEVADDDAPKKDVPDEASSLVSDDSTTKGSSLHQVKSLEDASQTVAVNGFDVCFSQVELVRLIFISHPDIALGFRPKSRRVRNAYMNDLLSLIKTLCQPPENLSEDDLKNADDTLAELSDVGFKLDWLKTKLNEASEKKKEPNTGDWLLEIEEKLQKMKLMLLDLETQVQMERKRLWPQELLPRSTM